MAAGKGRRHRTVILTARTQGATLTAFAEALNTDEIPTAQGGSRWWPSIVAAVRRSVELDSEAAAVAA